MKDGKPQSRIAQLLNRHKSTISRELARNRGNWGYRFKQAYLLAEERSLGSRNGAQIPADKWSQAVDYLLAQWSPVQIANQVGNDHETIYRHVYANKASGDNLYQLLRYQNNPRNTMPVVGIAEAKSSAGGRSVCVRPISRLESKSATGKGVP